MFKKKSKKSKGEKNFVGRIRIKRGHSLFKINKETLEVFKVDLNSIPVNRIQEPENPVQTRQRKVEVEEGFFYISALNFKNVVKKLTRLGLMTPAPVA